MLNPLPLTLLLLSLDLPSTKCAFKVRYHKSAKRERSQNDIYVVLSKIPSSVGVEDPPPYTTPEPPVAPSGLVGRRPVEYCLESRGQFRYDPDCHKFVDCWDGAAFVKSCFPATLVFHPESNQCRWPHDIGVRGLCDGDLSDGEGPRPRMEQTVISTNFSRPYCSDFSHLGYECVDEVRCVDGEIRTVQQVVGGQQTGRQQRGLPGLEGKFSPWMKICFDSREICCRNPNFKVKPRARLVRKKTATSTSLCPDDYSGVQPFPGDCSKFANCWKGQPTVQPCAPGTLFNHETLQCDFPSKVDCTVTSESAIARSAGRAPSLSFPSPPSGQRIRLREGRAAYSGYLELFHLDEWGYVCDADTWTMAEADLVCRQLGFVRGARSTTQGLVNGPVNEERKLTERVTCSGSESSLEKCRIDYTSSFVSNNDCKLSESVVSVTCVHDSLATCPPGEVPYGKSCYSVHFERADFHSAQTTCIKNGQMLAEVTNQQENDLLSELLLRHEYSGGLLASVWTGGLGSSSTARARAQIFYWHGSRQAIGFFRPWWPGWNGERKGQQVAEFDSGSTMAIKMSRKFDYVFRKNVREERLTDYYFWALADLRTELAFICERPQKDIGCTTGSGQDYMGSANRGESGDECVPWDSPALSFVLDEDKRPRLGPLKGNNFCRNPDGDTAPWCIAPNGEFDYCDIPQCEESVGEAPMLADQAIIDANMIQVYEKCDPDEFQCRVGECVLDVYVCDGQRDCTNGQDEAKCDSNGGLERFTKRGRRRLESKYLQRMLDSSVRACAGYCLKADGFVCRSFNYHAGKRLCTLSEGNVGTLGALSGDEPQWDYYELTSESVDCDDRLRCPSGKCLRDDQLCDGKNDCGGDDGLDERLCSISPNLRIRLVGGNGDNEGRVEIKAFNFGYGGICDDGFGLDEASVICRQLGFDLGAKEAVLNSQFGSGQGDILLDELSCEGDESDLLNCNFAPWRKHDCSDKEWAGVVCKQEQQECRRDEEWQCESGECISYDFLCDGSRDCVDGSDERKENLCELQLKARLAGGNNATAGRVEVRYKGVWGTVCDDNFGEEEGAVVCRMLGFEGRAIIHSKAIFDPGEGPIWIQNVACNGDERSLDECRASNDFWRPTTQCKHLEDVGIECVPSPNEVQREKLTCGRSLVAETPAFPVARIAGGLQAKPGSQPWAATVRLQGTHKSFHWCGAAILSQFHVVTAAHCMEDYPKNVYRIRVGDWDMQVPDLDEQEFEVDAIYFHEEYNVGLYLNNDIALIRIKAKSGGRGIAFGQRVVPVCLPPKNAVYAKNRNCTVAGWGSTGLRQPGYTRYLQATSVPLLDVEQCMSRQVYGPNRLGSGMFCAGFLEGGVDTCQGDSGGSLACKVTGDGGDRHVLMGLTSWGYGCGRPNRPGVYTKVIDYLDWIVEKMTIG